MTFAPRLYPDVVRDMLTVLTGGTVAETVVAPPLDLPIAPTSLKLRDRPVRYVSNLEGFVGPADKPLPFRFTPADFELVASGNDGLDTIRFRDGGRRPTPGTLLTVNYYPVAARPAPVDDLSVGSVVRTLIETAGYEIAVLYQHLDAIYRSAFVETADGLSLDKVVALVGVRRLPAGQPVTTLRFERGAGSSGRVAVPAGTVAIDRDGARYFTQEEIVLDPGETSRDVIAIGFPGAPEVAENSLSLEVLVAGIDRMSNPQAARRLAADETDDELRRRARGALAGASRGTLEALRFHLLSMAEVKNVTLVEAPDGRWGEVRADIIYADDSEAARQRVSDRIDQVRPAGIRIITAAGARRPVAVRVALTLAGAGVSGAELSEMQAAVAARLTALLEGIPPGGAVRRASLIAAVMTDARIADARITLTPEGGTAAEDLTLGDGEVLAATVTFDPVTAENASAISSEATVSMTLPIHLASGSTAAATRSAVETAARSHLGSRSSGAALTLDSLAAAIRDDSRFALIRAEAALTVESGDRFIQLTDGIGEYAPGPAERLVAGRIDIDVREGAI